MITETVVGVFSCGEHVYDVRMISPEVSPDGTVQGLFGSAADFCEGCEKPVEVLAYVQKYEELDNDEAVDLYKVRRSSRSRPRLTWE